MPKIAIVLTNGYADWECAFINGIGQAYYGLETTKAAPGGEPIASMGGVKTIPDIAMEHIVASGFDALVLCGGTIWETRDAPVITQLVVNFQAAQKPVAAICGATLALAKAGFLNDVRHTSNAAEFLTNSAPSYKGAAHYVNKVTAIEDRNIITAPGTAPAHFSAAVFKAVGIDHAVISAFLGMLAAEHKPGNQRET